MYHSLKFKLFICFVDYAVVHYSELLVVRGCDFESCRTC